MAKRIQSKLLIPICMVVVGVFVTSTAVSFYLSRQSILRTYKKQSQQTMRQLASFITEWLESREQEISSIASLQQFQAVLQLDPASQPNRDVSIKELAKLQQQYTYYRNINVADMSGRIIVSSDPKLMGTQAHQEVLVKIGTPGTQISAAHFDESSNQIVFCVISPLRDSNGTGAGVLFGELRWQKFNERFIDPVRLAKTGFVYIYDENGTILAHNNRDQLYRNISEIKPANDPRDLDSDIHVYQLEGDAIMDFHVPVAGVEWTIGTVLKQKEIFQPSKDLALIMGFSALLALLLLLVVVYGVLRKVVIQPIQQLTEFSVKLQHRDLATTIGSMAEDELGQLGTAFDSMRQSLRQSFREIEDYNATLTGKVNERTKALDEQTKAIRSLLQSLPVGVITVDSEGKITSDYSLMAAKILGISDPAHQLVQEAFFDQLNLPPEEKSIALSAMATCLGENELNFEFNSPKLPQSVQIVQQQNYKDLDVTWSCVTADDGTIQKLIIVFRDITQLKALQKQAFEKTKEIAIISNLLKSGNQRTRDALWSIQDAINRLAELPVSTRNQQYLKALAILHTMKGNSRTFLFDLLSNEIHQLETELAEVDSNSIARTYEAGLKRLTKIFRLYYSHAKRLNIPVDRTDGASSQDIVSLPAEVIGNLNQICTSARAGKPIAYQQELERLVSFLQTSRCLSLKQILDPTIQSLQKVADMLEKPMPNIVFQGGNLQLYRQHEITVVSIFNHLFRNSMDHGLECPDDRRALGKDPVGTITIDCQEPTEGNGMVIRYWEDGRGLDIKKIKAKGVQKNLLTPAEQRIDKIVSVIFAAQFTSRQTVTEVSGRGIGLDAIKDILSRNGGDIQVSLGDPQQPGFMSFYFVLELPGDLFFADPFPLDHKTAS